ncbi:MAG TPA: C45 family peptidase, partial [Vicinamibacterales bacterium]|nr:C45 family peptidase [Vicinamibacterales bacterium]
MRSGSGTATVPTIAAAAPEETNPLACVVAPGSAGQATPVTAAPPETALASVRLSGTHYEIGKQHAGSQGDQIKHILQRYANLLPAELEQMRELQEALAKRDVFFTAAGLEELQGVADELRHPVEHLIGYNLGLYPPRLGGCAQFAISARANGHVGMIHGVNEDSPLSLTLPGCLTRLVQVRHPDGAIPHIIFSASGQLGGLNGINAQGLAVTSTMLLDRRTSPSAHPGRINPVLVKTILELAQNIEQALEIVQAAPKVGAWSLCLSHHPTDRLCYLEYDGNAVQFQDVHEGIETTNHSVLHAPTQAVPAHSLHRLNRLRDLLGTNGRNPYTVAKAQEALRDRYDLRRKRATPHPTMNTIRRLDNQMSLVMHPARGEAWVTPGPIINGKADHYGKLNLVDLLGVPAPTPRRLPPERSYSSAARDSHLEDRGDGRTMSRFVLRMVDRPRERNTVGTLRLHGAALI